MQQNERTDHPSYGTADLGSDEHPSASAFCLDFFRVLQQKSYLIIKKSFLNQNDFCISDFLNLKSPRTIFFWAFTVNLTIYSVHFG